MRWRRERERERERARERESESTSGERGGRRAKERVEGGASEGVEGDVFMGARKSIRKGSFGVESKSFKVKVEEQKGKVQATIVERKGGISSWIRLGPKSIGFFFNGLVLCIKDAGSGKWERKWRESGRVYSLVRDQNKGGCFLRLEVADLENKRFYIFIPKGKEAKGGWVSMVEMLRRLGFTNGEEGCQKKEVLLSKPSMGKTYAEVAKQPKGKEKVAIRVEIRKKKLSRNLNKLAHCLVGIWNLSSVKGDDLRTWGTYLANFWGLKGNLGLGKLERGKVLLDFEFLAEAEKALKIGGISVGGSLFRLEKWRPELGCLMDGEKRSEAWVHIV